MSASVVEGHLLCLLPFPEPKQLTEHLKRQYPQLEVTYIFVRLGADWKTTEKIPNDIWKNVTILMTLAAMPPDAVIAPRLKLLHLLSAGTDHIRAHPLYTQSAIPITTCAGVAAPAIAQWVSMSILTASRRYDTLREWQRQQSWDQAGAGKELFFGSSSVAGKRIGILGYGAVGRHVATICNALGMEVVAYTASKRASIESRRYTGYIVSGAGDYAGTVPIQWHGGADKHSLHSFLAQDLDYFLISVPLTDSTWGMIGAEELAVLAKRNALLLNISRGEVLDQDALIRALREFDLDQSGPLHSRRRGLSGAALDVTVPEPLPPLHPLWETPNVFISPHISGMCKEHFDHAFRILEQNLERIAEGTRLLNEIERHAGYAAHRSSA